MGRAAQGEKVKGVAAAQGAVLSDTKSNEGNKKKGSWMTEKWWDRQ